MTDEQHRAAVVRVVGEVMEGEPALQALEANGTRPGTPRSPLRIERAELIVR